MAEEITNTEGSKDNKQGKNAFTELMTPRPKRAASSPIEPKPSRLKPFKNRNGLDAYIEAPESFSQSTVISHSDDFVIINDLYPKSAIHLLLLPRDPTKFFQHPFDAFEDAEFLKSVRAEASKVRKQAASELRRKFGRFSALDQARSEALDADPAPDELPGGRDWEKEIMCGIHAHPSMNHLHVHIISVDRCGACIRHRKHYNSFSTPFFVSIDDFPLAEDDERRHPDREGYLKSDLKCWRCERNFGNKFTQLKAHLEEEFEDWKRI
ncbi:aprataxin-like protein [Arthroderma uncinatum]|uniref:aprataxin-like protein n=1 Tax=Arthroderma uncinatum TaxID=74035 RepID=UPI00144A7CDF|nr:aprataxin-like protein [Arthroderma uncinatum]KAF3483283.1 aprataxin-like protein [Arthroderma uncinatum]